MTPSERIDELIAAIPDWRSQTFAAIRRVILAADPQIIEEFKWMGSPVWERDGIIAVADAHKGKVKLTLAYGAHLPDPDKLFNAGLEGAQRRAIDVFEGDKINESALTALIRAGVDYNQARRMNPTKARTQVMAPRKKGRDPSGAVVLLSGGNPQIAKADGDAPVQAYITALPGWKSDLGRRLDGLIVRTLPNVQKAVKWNSPFYGVEGRGWFLGVHAFKTYLKVAFFQGAALQPPPGPSKDANTRYLDIREGDELDEAQFADWVKQAAALPGYLAPKS